MRSTVMGTLAATAVSVSGVLAIGAIALAWLAGVAESYDNKKENFLL